MTKVFNPRSPDRHWLIQLLIALILALLLSTQVEAQEKTFIGLTLADIATTGYIISTGGHELNPLLPEDNIPLLAVIKIAIAIGYLKTEPSKKELWIMNFIISTPVINNTYQIIRHSRGK